MYILFWYHWVIYFLRNFLTRCFAVSFHELFKWKYASKIFSSNLFAWSRKLNLNHLFCLHITTATKFRYLFYKEFFFDSKFLFAYIYYLYLGLSFHEHYDLYQVSMFISNRIIIKIHIFVCIDCVELNIIHKKLRNKVIKLCISFRFHKKKRKKSRKIWNSC